MKSRIALFDLDHTLLHGDTDVLWCNFLMDRGLLERDVFTQRNQELAARYHAGTVDAAEFAVFYVGTLAGRSPGQWKPLRRAFTQEVIVPRIPRDALALVRHHLQANDQVLLTTATNRFLAELTARHFGISNLLATEPDLSEGVFNGRTKGTLNMREGKIVRLHQWLAERGQSLRDLHSIAYSDSINDLPLLQEVDIAVAVDPDPRLEAIARDRGWTVLHLR